MTFCSLTDVNNVVMIANLLVMVIIGGYEIFVSRLDIQDHSDQPEWLSHVDAGVFGSVYCGHGLVNSGKSQAVGALRSYQAKQA